MSASCGCQNGHGRKKKPARKGIVQRVRRLVTQGRTASRAARRAGKR